MSSRTNHVEQCKLLIDLVDGPDLSSILETDHEPDKVAIDLTNNLINIDWFFRKVSVINYVFYKSKDKIQKKILFEHYQKELEVKCKNLEETEKYCSNLFNTIKYPPGSLKISDEFRPTKYSGVFCAEPHPALSGNFANSRLIPILRDIGYNAHKIIKTM